MCTCALHLDPYTSMLSTIRSNREIGIDRTMGSGCSCADERENPSMEELVLGERGRELVALDRKDNARNDCKSHNDTSTSLSSHQDSQRTATPTASTGNATAGSAIPYRNSFAAETLNDASFKSRRKAATRFVSQINDSRRPDLVKIDREVGLRAHMDFCSVGASELPKAVRDVVLPSRPKDPQQCASNPLTGVTGEIVPGVDIAATEECFAECEGSNNRNTVGAGSVGDPLSVCRFSSIVMFDVMDDDCSRHREFNCGGSSLVVEISTTAVEH